MKSTPRSAFTLLEMLLVISIIGILSTLVAPAVNTMMRGSRQAQAGDKVVAILNQARQMALTTDHTVEVRFYQYGDAGVPGESASDPTTGKYRAIQAVEYKDDGTVLPGKVEKLPPSIIIDAGTTLSNLLGQTKTDKDNWGSDATGTPLTKPSILNVRTSYNCCSFRFLSDGSTDLAATKLWFLTLHNQLEGDSMATPPPNYTTIKIDPVNGALKVYRP